MTHFIGTENIYALTLMFFFLTCFMIGIVLTNNSHQNKINNQIKVIEDKLEQSDKLNVELRKEIRNLIENLKS
jgi:hypothetical protein